MILVYGFGLVHFAHVEGVAVGVVVSDCEVDGFDGVEGKAHGFVRKCDFLDGGFASQIVENNGAVHARGAEDVGIRRIVLDLENRIDIPLKLIDGFGSLVRPHLNHLPRSGKLIFLRRMVHITNDQLAEVLGERLHYFFLPVYPIISVNVFIAILAVEHGLEVIEMDGLVSRRGEEPESIFGEGNSLDGLIVVIQGDEAFAFGDVPNPDLSVVRTRDHLVECERTLCKDADAVRMTCESAEERLCEDFVELGRVIGALELPGSREGMLSVGRASD